MNYYNLSIIILSYNTKELLRHCLRSIKEAEKSGITLQVIVVDNNSVDSSPEVVKEEFPWVELIVCKENLGYAGGNNLGLKRAKGEYIIFLNSDVEIKKDALVRIIDFMKDDKDIGAVTPRVDLYIGGMDPDCHRGFPTPWASLTYFLGLEKLFPRSKLFGEYHLGYFDLSKSHEIDSGFGTFMIVRKNVIDEVGPWDERYFFYGEDLDFFYRIKKAGWKVMFYPKVLALHHKGASSGLRKESKFVTKADKKITLKTTVSSIKAWEVFYKKFYKGKYNLLVTSIVLMGIKIKGFFRIVRFRLYN